jgi:hypothetical protein
MLCPLLSTIVLVTVGGALAMVGNAPSKMYRQSYRRFIKMARDESPAPVYAIETS